VIGPGATDPGPLVRPYALTDGRTEPSRGDLAIEDLVGAIPGADQPRPWLSFEHQSIALLCRQLHSVAEIAGRLELPLGVARILVADLVNYGLVVIHPAPSHTGGPDVALLEQVLHGLHRL
jgi:Protein of unknown function (DUF742)